MIYWMIIVMLFGFGLILGSFVNALVWRLHQQTKLKGKSKKANVDLSIWRGRSICPNCKHQLAAKDLIPVISWLSLRGKCRYCGKPISWQYPLVELLTAALFVFSYAYWPFDISGKGAVLFGFWLIFLVGLVALAVYDIRWMKLPDKIIRVLLGVALIQSAVLLIYGPFIRQFVAIGAAWLVGGGIFYVIYQISNGKWIGGGDVKLGALLGLMLADGWLMVLTIFIASILGTLIALPMLISGKYKKDSRIPFGPFLIVGAIIARLFGAAIINWYTTKLII